MGLVFCKSRMYPSFLSRMFFSWIFAASLLSATTLNASGDDAVLHVRNSTPLLEVEEVADAPGADSPGWQSIYSAYGCVYHHSYALASRWILFALKQGAGNTILKARNDGTFLSQGLSRVAAQRKEASITASSCDVQILQGLMETMVSASTEDGIDILKRAAANNPSYKNLQFLKNKIRDMEFERSGNPWLAPPDVAQSGGKGDGFSKWREERFPLKIYIPTDATASKIEGYRAGDGQLLRNAFEIWRRESGGKLRFVYEPVKVQADISCEWTGDQKMLEIADAVGLCVRTVFPKNNYLIRSTIKILTFKGEGHPLTAVDDSYRKSYLEEVCLHEIGHSLGLNHSSSTNDVMWMYCHKQPLESLTSNDVAALNSLYRASLQEYLGDAIDCIQRGQYKAAVVPLNKAIGEHPKDNQTLNTICVCLNNLATAAMHDHEYSLAVEYLTKANGIASVSESNKQQVLKNLHHAYLQNGNDAEAESLEKQNPSLASKQNRAAFLDHYGLKRESLPKYEEALANNPNDLSVRETFCFLLVMLAKDESTQNNDDEAISLLTRARGMLREGMSPSIRSKVTMALRQAFLDEERYEEADEMMKKPFESLSAEKGKKVTSEEDIAALVASSKKAHPERWSDEKKQKAERSKIAAAYLQYVTSIKECATTMKANEQKCWAPAFIVRNREHDLRGAQDPLGKLFMLRHQLIDLTDEDGVISLEAGLEPKLKEDPSRAQKAPSDCTPYN